jgi:hypothetical protein
MQYPVADRRVVEHPAQSTSEKAHKFKVVLEVKYRPISMVPLTYRGAFDIS